MVSPRNKGNTSDVFTPIFARRSEAKNESLAFGAISVNTFTQKHNIIRWYFGAITVFV